MISTNKATEIDNKRLESSDQTETNCVFATRLGKCEVCAANDARYTCPKCELKTCSLACVRIHKKELECDGKRDRTKFVPLRSMSNMDFMSDYYFLEECTRYVQDRKTDGIKRFTRFNKQLPTHLYRLRAATNERGTKLMFLLQNFTRHKENTTYYDWKERRIYWRVEWIFMNAGEGKYIDERCDEDLPLWKLLERYLNAEQAALQNIPERRKLEFYQTKGAFGIRILLKSEHVKNCKKRFYELDASKSLKENLKGKILVEFPVIFLFSDSHIDDLDILDSDEDVEAETKAFLNSLDQLRKEHFAKTKAEAEAKAAESDEEESKAKESSPESKRVAKKQKCAKLENQPKNFLFNENDESFSSSDDEQQTSGHNFLGANS